MNLQKRIEDLEKELEILKKENNKKKFPEYNTSYYYLTSDNGVIKKRWLPDKIDDYHFFIENCFIDYNDAEKRRRYNEIEFYYLKFIKEFNGDWVPDWGNIEEVKLSLCFDFGLNFITYSESHTKKFLSNKFYFGKLKGMDSFSIFIKGLFSYLKENDIEAMEFVNYLKEI